MSTAGAWTRRKASEWQLYRRQRYVRLAFQDVADQLRGRADPELPSRRARDFVGGGDFRAVGQEFAGYASDLADLQPDDRVLEIGSGIGRIALALTDTIGPDGSYQGLEIVRRGVRWCQTHISASHPNFQFHHANIENGTYNRRGQLAPEDYVFPFPDDSFDLVLLTSVFTHMLPGVVDHYLSEIGRVLAPEGRMLATFYLLNPESLERMSSGHSVVDFAHAVGDARVMDADVPENAVALAEPWVDEAIARHGMGITAVHYGSWCERPEGLSHQDIVVAVRSD